MIEKVMLFIAGVSMVIIGLALMFVGIHIVPAELVIIIAVGGPTLVFAGAIIAITALSDILDIDS